MTLPLLGLEPKPALKVSGGQKIFRISSRFPQHCIFTRTRSRALAI